MDIVDKTEDGVRVLQLSGRLDGQTAVDLEGAITPLLDSEGKLLVDFAEVPFVSSAGLRVVLIGAKKMGARKAHYALTGLKPEVFEIFEMSGFTKILTIHDDLAAGMEAMNAL